MSRKPIEEVENEVRWDREVGRRGIVVEGYALVFVGGVIVGLWLANVIAYF